jgi:hypothetical protein
MQQHEAGIDELPTGPGSRIIRSAAAEAWQDGPEFCLQSKRWRLRSHGRARTREPGSWP